MKKHFLILVSFEKFDLPKIDENIYYIESFNDKIDALSFLSGLCVALTNSSLFVEFGKASLKTYRNDKIDTIMEVGDSHFLHENNSYQYTTLEELVNVLGKNSYSNILNILLNNENRSN